METSKGLKSSNSLLSWIDELKANTNVFLHFYPFVGSQMCLEALNFIIGVEEYRSSTRSYRTLKEVEIVNRYVKVGASEQINITMSVKEKIITSLGTGDSTVFDEAQTVCIKLLQGESWFDFHKTEEYKKALESKPLKGKLLEKALQKVVAPHVFPAAVWVFTGRRLEDEISEVDSEKSVVILGGGVMGVLLAKQLIQKYKKRIRVTIVDKKPYFEFPSECIPFLFETVKINEYKDQTAYPYEQIFHGLRIDTVQGDILKVTPQKVMISTTTLHYDVLVVCTGCSYSKLDLNHGRSVEWNRDEDYSVQKLIQKANSIMVVGGGLPGVNTAAYTACLPEKEVTLVHPGKELIPGLSSDTDEKIRKYLRSKMVVVLPNSSITITPPRTPNGKYSMQLVPSYQSDKIKKDHVKHTLAESPLFSSTDADLILWCDKLVPNTGFMERHFSSSISENKFLIVNNCFQVDEPGISNKSRRY